MSLIYTSLETPLGAIYLGQSEKGLCCLALGDTAERDFFHNLAQTFPAASPLKSDQDFQPTIDQLELYFKGQLYEFDLELDLRGTPFQKSVWSELQKIPYGQTISYGELAKRLNSPGGMRAVGAANGQNPVPIIVPCHRVIAADGSLGGYTGGLGIKRKLLDIEQQKYTPTLF